MALAPLATEADLAALKIDTSDAATTVLLLASASSAVRDAAGVPISRKTSVATLLTETSRRIELPGRPVHTVSSVLLDGVAIDDYRLRGSGLWRLGCYWQLPGDIPGEVTVTMDHGYTEVPADIVTLVCSLVAGGLAAVENGYDPKRGMSYERIDDYQYGMQTGDDEIVDPFELPKRTKASLRARFSGGAHVVGSIR